MADPGYLVRESGCGVKELPMSLRPREEAERVGVGNIPDAALIALILRAGTSRNNVIDIANGVLSRYGSLSAIAAASEAELCHVPGIGPVKAQILKAALELGRRLKSEGVPRGMPIVTPRDVYHCLIEEVRSLRHETFWVLLLDAKNRLHQRPLQVSQGVLDSSLVHPREVFRRAIAESCSAVVLAHNHPSGDPTPSSQDLAVTRQLIESGKLLDIRVLDHIVLGAPGGGTSEFVSLREENLVKFG